MPVVWSFPTRVVFGKGVVGDLGDEVDRAGMKRPLVVTDRGVVAAGLLRAVTAALEKAGLEHAVFDGVDGNPTEANVEAGVGAYAAHRADGVVGLGGGSPLDTAKLVALRSRVAHSFEELDDAVGGERLIPADVPPVVAIPTTAGTGSEVGRSGVVTVRSTGRKLVVFSPYLLPRIALLDPELTQSMPPHVTAATGFDALTHCVEAYWSLGDHPMADAIALGGIELVAAHLERAVAHGADIAARGAMMKAAMMGAVAFQKGLGACHSLAHPLSTQHGVHHGLANALCLPAVAAFNEAEIPERVGRVATLLGSSPGSGAAATALAALRSRIGLPSGLGAVGVEARHLDTLSTEAFDDACHRLNPRPCTRLDLLALYQASM